MAAQERARRPRNRARKPKNRARTRKNAQEFLGQTSVKNWHVTLVSTMIQQHFMRNCMDTYLMRSQWTVTTNMSWIIHDVWVNMCISWVFPTNKGKLISNDYLLGYNSCRFLYSTGSTVPNKGSLVTTGPTIVYYIKFVWYIPKIQQSWHKKTYTVNIPQFSIHICPRNRS